jgi:tetratricopeptide (TPR) repeat protein
MKAERLLGFFYDPQKITLEDVQGLQDLLQQCPYFQAAYALLAKAACDRDRSSADQSIQIAAVYATDRNHLKALLEDNPPFSTPAPGAIPVTLAPEEKASPKAGEYAFIHDYINTIQQKVQQKITKQKSLAQLDSIQAFLQKDVDFKPQPLQTLPQEDFQVDLTQQSTAFHDDLATETLAQILWQQGKLQRALAIYEKLMLKFPEKRTYFDALIETLKHQI